MWFFKSKSPNPKYLRVVLMFNATCITWRKLFCNNFSVKHSGNLTLEQIINVARQMRSRSMAKKLEGTVKEILGIVYTTIPICYLILKSFLPSSKVSVFFRYCSISGMYDKRATPS